MTHILKMVEKTHFVCYVDGKSISDPLLDACNKSDLREFNRIIEWTRENNINHLRYYDWPDDLKVLFKISF